MPTKAIVNRNIVSIKPNGILSNSVDGVDWLVNLLGNNRLWRNSIWWLLNWKYKRSLWLVPDVLVPDRLVEDCERVQALPGCKHDLPSVVVLRILSRISEVLRPCTVSVAPSPPIQYRPSRRRWLRCPTISTIKTWLWTNLKKLV